MKDYVCNQSQCFPLIVHGRDAHEGDAPQTFDGGGEINFCPSIISAFWKFWQFLPSNFFDHILPG